MNMYMANYMSPTAWIIIAVVLLVLFGGTKIPEVMRGLGQGMKEFKKGMSENEPDDELEKAKRAEEEREKKIRARVEEEMRKGGQ